MKLGLTPSQSIALKLRESSRAIARALNRLSTGLRVQSARDDVAAFSTSTRLRAQTRGLLQINQSLSQAAALTQTASLALSSQMEILQKMKDIAVQASSQTLSSSQRASLNQELISLRDDFQKIALSTQFAGRDLFNQPQGLEFLLSENTKLTIPSSKNLLADSFEKTVGSGTYGSFQSFLGAEPGARAVFSDLNGNGRDEMLYLDAADGVFGLYQSNGNGTFTQVQSFDVAAQAAVGDINGNGLQEIIAFSNSTDSLNFKVLSSSGGLSYTETADISIAAAGVIFNTFYLADLNNNGRLDILAGNSSNTAVFLNDGSGNFSFSHSFAKSVPAALVDINGDGVLDIVRNSEVALGNGDGTFSGSTSLGFGLGGGFAFGDLNGNGINDIVVPRGAVGGIDVYLGSATGSYTHSATLLAGEEIYSVALTDFNRDGKLDLVAFNYSNESLDVLIGLGNAEFSLKSQQSLSFGVSSDAILYLPDLNGNGINDFFLIFADNVVQAGIQSTQIVKAIADIRVTDPQAAERLLGILDGAIEKITDLRAQSESFTTRIERSIESNLLLSESLEEARKRLVETDFVLETAELVRQQILQQAQIAALTQANTQQSSLLELLRALPSNS